MSLTTWRKSSFSSEPEGNCVEVAIAPVEVAVRDSKNTVGPTLSFGRRTWCAFTGDVSGRVTPAGPA